MRHLKHLAALASPIDGYAEGAPRKVRMHQQGRAFLKRLAADLGLAHGQFDIRSNVAGPAVSGEVTLHADHIYVQLSEHYSCAGVGVLYRTCKHRTDYTGGRNHTTTMRNLVTRYPEFVAECRALMQLEGVMA